MWQTAKRAVISVVCGLLGAALFYVGLLAYQDHQLCEAIRAADRARLMQAAQQIQQRQPPAAPTPAAQPPK